MFYCIDSSRILGRASDDEVQRAIAIKGSSSFASGMSLEDSARYNRWMDVREAGYNIPWEDYLKIKRQSIRNLNGENMTLGKYIVNKNGQISPEAYISKAKATRDMYFDLGENWDTIKQQYNLSDTAMFELFNKSAIDDAVNSGKGICFSQDPTLSTYKGTFIEKEWIYLKETLKFTDLIYEGGYWHAIK